MPYKFNTYTNEFIVEKYLRNAAFAFTPIGKLIDDRWKLGQIDFCKLNILFLEYMLDFQAVGTSSCCVNYYSAHIRTTRMRNQPLSIVVTVVNLA